MNRMTKLNSMLGVVTERVAVAAVVNCTTHIEGIYDDETTINSVRLGNCPISVNRVRVGC
ncbi:hypothetical protein CCP3SC5AM1_1270002 [Gammaproteobacteria bacterium]